MATCPEPCAPSAVTLLGSCRSRVERHDLRDEYVRRAVEAGALLAIDSDAHEPAHLGYANELGVAVARRGWVRKAEMVNTLPVTRCLARLKDRGGARRRRGRGPRRRRR